MNKNVIYLVYHYYLVLSLSTSTFLFFLYTKYNVLKSINFEPVDSYAHTSTNLRSHFQVWPSGIYILCTRSFLDSKVHWQTLINAFKLLILDAIACDWKFKLKKIRWFLIADCQMPMDLLVLVIDSNVTYFLNHYWKDPSPGCLCATTYHIITSSWTTTSKSLNTGQLVKYLSF
jgi:hypothetical protein